MIRQVTQSLAGQLIGLLLAGILAAHLIALPLSSTGNGGMHPISREQVLERYVMAYQVMAACMAPCDRKRLLDALLPQHDGSFDIRTENAPVRPSNASEFALAQALSTRLAILHPGHVIALLASAEAPNDKQTLTLSARLPDGKWLNGHFQPVIRKAWWRPLFFSIPVSTIPVLLVAALFARRILRPAQALALAAEQVSRGEQIDPLIIRGPREIREVTSAFNIMQERLRRYVSDRTRMIAAISHDFRTPITSLRLRAEMIDDACLRHAMIRTLEEMRVMMEETLNFARDDSHHEATVSTELHTLIIELAREQQALGRKVSYDNIEALSYRCRPIALKRALSNLVENAVRYGHNAQLRLTRDTTGDVHIVVDDDGPGIPAEWLEKVFEPFARPDKERHKDVGGVGLGLSITRSCIEAHGGQVTLMNRPAGGLRASIVLPA